MAASFANHICKMKLFLGNLRNLQAQSTSPQCMEIWNFPLEIWNFPWKSGLFCENYTRNSVREPPALSTFPTRLADLLGKPGPPGKGQNQA